MLDCTSNWLLLAVALVTAFFAYCKWRVGFFERRGVRSAPGMVPFFGNMMNFLLRREHIKDIVMRSYNSCKDQKYIGFMQMNNHLLLIKDIELLKQLSIKDFDYFQDHITFVDEQNDPLFGNNLFTLKGQKWRDMRATLSPAFTSSKMRNMFSLVEDCGAQMADYYSKQIEQQLKNNNGEILHVEMKDAFTRYANDVIASTAFGIQVNSLDERDNDFYLMGKKATNFSGIAILKIFAFTSCPRIMRYFKVTLLTADVIAFFRSIFGDTIKDREASGLVRPDMIQLLMEAKKGSLSHDATPETKDAGFATVEESSLGKISHKREWSDDELTAQAVLFFIAGFDTSSTLLSFLAHELTIHPEIQKKLQEEIDEVVEKNVGKVKYKELQAMKYMDMVVSETLRFWPPVVTTDRKCVKPYTMPPPNDSSNKKYTLKVGEGIWIPVFAIHHDPQYYPDPEKFDPERFSDDNKDSIIPNTFLPFGLGPRNCIGSRFALMEAKAVVFHLLAKFDMVVTEKTGIPLKLNNNSFTMNAKNGFWIGLKKRANKM